jgi:hypothetical protein
VITPSRALGDKKGDQQARAELLGKLLAAIGEKPYMLCHGTGRNAHYLLLLRVPDVDVNKLSAAAGKNIMPVHANDGVFVALSLERGATVGTFGKQYNAEKKTWTDAIAVTPFK